MAKVVSDTGFSSSSTNTESVNSKSKELVISTVKTADFEKTSINEKPEKSEDHHHHHQRVLSSDDRNENKHGNEEDDDKQPTGDPDVNNNILREGENSDSKEDDEKQDKSSGVVLLTGRMNGDMPERDEGWRAYYEHPLTAATTAMLNINGAEANEEQQQQQQQQQQQSNVGLLYEYYKLQPIDKSANANKSVTLAVTTQGNTEEIWSPSSTISPTTVTTSVTSLPKTVESVITVDTAKLQVNNQDIAELSPQHQQQVVLSDQQMNAFLMNQGDSTKDGDESGRSIILNCKVNSAGEVSEENAQSISSIVHSDNSTVMLPNGGMNSHQNHSAIISIIKQEPPDDTNVISPSVTMSQSILAAELKAPSSNRIVKSPVVDNSLVSQQPMPGTPGTPSAPGTPIIVETVPTALSPTEIVAQSPQPPSYQNQVFATLQQAQVYEPVTIAGSQYGILPGLSTVVAVQPSQVYGTQSSENSQTTTPTVYSLTTTEYYRDYYGTEPAGTGNAQTSVTNTDQFQTSRQQIFQTTNGQDSTMVERYIRQGANTTAYKNGTMGLTVDLPSPDSGIGETAVTPRDSTGLSQMFDYTDLSHGQTILTSPDGTTTITRQGGQGRRSWHEYGRGTDTDKVQIPKIYSEVGFKYNLESPISTSQRREDDRITYINKGQFYGITLEYIPDPDKPLRCQTVKSMIMLVFREEKSQEDEIKAWQFWHSRQHSVKQRILDADSKNSSGIIGCVEEITHNAITFYWNPLEGPAKVNIAVQCLSTDFSNQKGVKGLPLHLQIDTFEDVRDTVSPVHRGYCQIKVFCDKGAERKTRDEERRAAKRKLTATGRKKMDEMYHPSCERSEFYGMSDLLKPPVLFSPSEDIEKMAGMELSFYNQSSQSSDDMTLNTSSTSTVRVSNDAKETSDLTASQDESMFPLAKRQKTSPPSNERVMLYVRQENEDAFNALHLVPPSLYGLCTALENKYNIRTENIKSIFKRSRKGITVRVDDDIIKHYSNEDIFILEITQVEENSYEITLAEL